MLGKVRKIFPKKLSEKLKVKQKKCEVKKDELLEHKFIKSERRLRKVWKLWGSTIAASCIGIEYHTRNLWQNVDRLNFTRKGYFNW